MKPPGIFAFYLMLGALVAVFRFMPCYAQSDLAQGMVVYRATLSDGPEYHRAALFRGFQNVAAWVDFDIGQAKPLRVEKGLVVKIIEFEVFDRNGNRVPAFSMDIVSEDDIRAIAELRSLLLDTANRSPKLVPTINATCDVLDKQIAEFRAGRVRSRGIWVEKSTLQPASRPMVGGSISVAGREYAGARVMSAKDGVVTLAHDGGVAKVPLASLSEIERQKLASSSGFDLAKVETSVPPPVLVPTSATAPMVAVTESTSIMSVTAPVAAGSLPVGALPATIEVDAQGSGTSPDEALKDALRDAVRRSVGTLISSEQIVKNDEIIRDQVIAHSDAFVHGYDKISEKHDAGLFQVGIRARVVRAKLAERLTASGLIGKTEVQGENMFAEALTKLDKANSAKELLTKLFTGFPHVFCRPQLIGKPAITGQTETTATLRLRVRVGVDQQAYAIWYQQAVTVLGQVCSKRQPFSNPRVELRDAERLREEFESKLYNEAPPSANDDPEIARFNPRLDGLVPVLKSMDQASDVPRVGLRVFVSKSISGLNGDAYDLGADETAAVLGAVNKLGKSDADAWRKLDKVKVAFLDAAGGSVRTELLDLGSRKIESGERWLAPYGGIYRGNDSKLQLICRPPYDREHAMLIQPGFVLCRSNYSTKNSSDACILTAGVAFDFVLEVPLDEIRNFTRLELSWPQD